MKSISRRSFIGVASKGAGLFFLGGLIGCSDKITEVIIPEDSLTKSDIKFAEYMFEDYSNFNLSGDALTGSKLDLLKGKRFDSASKYMARDSVVVVDNFELVKVVQKDGDLIFNVKCKYYGNIKGEKFYNYSLIKTKKNLDVVFKFKVAKKNDEFFLKTSVPSFCSKKNVLIHYKNLISDIHNEGKSSSIVQNNKLGNYLRIVNTLETIRG